MELSSADSSGYHLDFFTVSFTVVLDVCPHSVSLQTFPFPHLYALIFSLSFYIPPFLLLVTWRIVCQGIIRWFLLVFINYYINI